MSALSHEWQNALSKTYYTLQNASLKLLIATYFGALQENLQLVCDLPVDGLHIDGINAREEVDRMVDWLPSHKVLSLGVVNGRNIWKANLSETFNWLEPLHKDLQNRL